MVVYRKINILIMAVSILFLCVNCLSIQNENLVNNNMYSFYDEKFNEWNDNIQRLLGNTTSMKINLFTFHDVSELKKLTIYSSEDFSGIEYIKNTLKLSKRIRWQVENGKEERTIVESLAAGEIVFDNTHKIYIRPSFFQERTTGEYLDFSNIELKKWIDEKVKLWVDNNSPVFVYDNIESDKKIELYKWYKNKTCYHPGPNKK